MAVAGRDGDLKFGGGGSGGAGGVEFGVSMSETRRVSGEKIW